MKKDVNFCYHYRISISMNLSEQVDKKSKPLNHVTFQVEV